MTMGVPSILSVADALRAAEPRPGPDAAPAAKKNYAERLSRHLATCFANRLRAEFPGIMPDESGRKQEAPARTAKGFKRLDVNYSTPQLGLALGVSIKTINFADARSRRFTKNYSRVDAELRAEATDYHQRQPYAVLVGVLFLPTSSCDDALLGSDQEAGTSSFGAAGRYFRSRAGRITPHDDVDLFERFFLCAYDESTGHATFFDVMNPPPRNRRLRPEESLDLAGVIHEIVRTYNERNDPPFEWAE